jgi:hypothetical protein
MSNIASFGIGIEVKGEGVERDIGKVIRGAETQVGRLGASLNKGIESSLKNAVSSLSGLGSAGVSAGNGLATLGASAGPIGAAAAGVAALGAGLLSSLNGFNELTKSVQKVVDVTGASAESASRTIEVFGSLGISTEQTAKAFATLSRNADSKAFKALAIDIVKTKDGATDLTATFGNVLKKLEGINDPIGRANVLQASFGKSYADLLPVITQGVAAFERQSKAVAANQILSSKDLENGKAYRASLDNLGDSVGRIKNAAGKTLLPIAADTLNALATYVENLLDGATAITKFVKESAAFEAVREVFAKVAKVIGSVVDTISSITFDDVKRKIQDIIDFADKVLGPLINFDNNVFKLSESTSKVNKEFADFRAGERETSAAMEKISVATEETTKRIDTFGLAAEANGDAIKRLFAGPTNAAVLANATKGAADAQASLNDQLGKGLAGQIQGAEIALKGAQARRADIDATKALASARAAEKDAATKGAEAEAAARLKVKDAATAVAKAKADAAKIAVEADDRVEKATARVLDAQTRLPAAARAVEAAQRAQVSQHRDLVTAVEKELRAQEDYERVIGRLAQPIDVVTTALERQAAARNALADLSDSLATIDDQLVKAKTDSEQFAASGQAQGNEAVIRLRIREAASVQSVADAERALAEGRGAVAKGGKDGTEAATKLRGLELAVASARLDQVAAARELANSAADLLDVTDTQAEKLRRVEGLERRRLEIIARQKKEGLASTEADRVVAGVTTGFGADSPEAKAAKDRAEAARLSADGVRQSNEEAALSVQDALDAQRKANDDVKAAQAEVTKAVDEHRKAVEKVAEARTAAAAVTAKAIEAERAAQADVTGAVAATKLAREAAAASTRAVIEDEKLRQLTLTIEVFKTKKAAEDTAKAVKNSFDVAIAANLTLITAGGNAAKSIDTLRSSILGVADKAAQTALLTTLDRIKDIQKEASKLQLEAAAVDNNKRVSSLNRVTSQTPSVTTINVNNPVGVPTKKSIKSAVNAANSGLAKP